MVLEARRRASSPRAAALIVELGLHRVKEITIEDGGLFAGEVIATYQWSGLARYWNARWWTTAIAALLWLTWIFI